MGEFDVHKSYSSNFSFGKKKNLILVDIAGFFGIGVEYSTYIKKPISSQNKPWEKI